jgi:hypothetical protein
MFTSSPFFDTSGALSSLLGELICSGWAVILAVISEGDERNEKGIIQTKFIDMQHF